MVITLLHWRDGNYSTGGMVITPLEGWLLLHWRDGNYSTGGMVFNNARTVGKLPLGKLYLGKRPREVALGKISNTLRIPTITSAG